MFIFLEAWSFKFRRDYKGFFMYPYYRIQGGALCVTFKSFCSTNNIDNIELELLKKINKNRP
jgi:hypothetical protein